MPFDVGPLRTYRYMNDMAGAGRLEEHLRQAFEAAKSGLSILRTLRPKLKAWLSDAGYHDEAHLPTWTVLSELKLRIRSEELDDEWKSYLLAAAVRNGTHLDWWISVTEGSWPALEVTVETLLTGSYRRPRIRAAYVLDRQRTDIKAGILAALPSTDTDELCEALVEALKTVGVLAWVRGYDGPLLDHGMRGELLSQLRGGRRRFRLPALLS